MAYLDTSKEELPPCAVCGSALKWIPSTDKGGGFLISFNCPHEGECILLKELDAFNVQPYRH